MCSGVRFLLLFTIICSVLLSHYFCGNLPEGRLYVDPVREIVQSVVGIVETGSKSMLTHEMKIQLTLSLLTCPGRLGWGCLLCWVELKGVKSSIGRISPSTILLHMGLWIS